MPRERSGTESAAAGSPALATFFDDDLTDFLNVVDDLPFMADERGAAYAVDFGRTLLRAKLAILGLGGKAEVEVFLRRGSLWLMVEHSVGGRVHRGDFKEVAIRERFTPSVRVVYERAGTTTEKPYVPLIPKPTEGSKG